MLNLVLAGCSTGNPATGAGSSFRDNPITRFLGVAPSPVTSEYLQTLGGGYSARILDRRIAGYYCSMTFKPVKKLSAPLYLEVRFENPAGGPALITDAELDPGQQNVFVMSPDLHGLRDHHVYRIEVALYDSAAKTRQVGTHIQDLLCLWGT